MSLQQSNSHKEETTPLLSSVAHSAEELKSLVSKDSKKKEKVQKDKTDMHINDLNLILENFPSSEKAPKPEEKESKLLGKRKRKTERELKILRAELKNDVMWTRDSIKVMRQSYESEFSMSEQQIYKWWWDQTRKRSTKKGGLEDDEMDEAQLLSFQDEFGGYSSRLRHQLQNKKQKQKQEEKDEGLEINLCEMLGIDVEGIALRIAMGLEEDDQDNTDIEKRPTAASLTQNDIETMSDSAPIDQNL